MFRYVIQVCLGLSLLTGCANAQTMQSNVQSSNSVPAEIREPVTILISIDGFRPDYLDRGVTPHLKALAESGAYGPMRPAFPTKTFPNHWTLVTGKRPDRHGIVGNTMEDPQRPDEVFRMSTKDPFWWDQAEPIWITAEEQGVRSATMFWPGSEVEFDGNRPSDWWPFNQQLSNDRRIRAVVDWLRRPADIRPKLVTLYFDTVDTAGHFFGPANSDKLNAAIKEIDDRMGDLVRNLAMLKQPANIIVTSDHGMVETSPERIIYLDTIMPREQYRLITDGNYAGIEPLDGNIEEIREAFITSHENMECWEKENIPEHFRYGKNPRVPSIFCLPEAGWVVYQDVPEWMTGIGGGHGYDHRHPDMTAFFLANGPDIQSAGKQPVFDSVNIYAIVAYLAGVTPNESEGSIEPFRSFLAPRDQKN